MATVVFAAAAAAYGFSQGTVVAAVATSIGMYIDSAVIMPQLFGKPMQGPKLGDYELGSAEEGSPVPYPVGRTCIVPGQVIWLTDLKEIKKSESGGKGGGGGDFITYTYYVDCAIGLCKRQIKRVLKLWANGKLIYDIAPDVDYTSTQLSVQPVSTFVWNTFTQTWIETKWMDLKSSTTGPDLSKLKSGKSVNVSGFSTAANNGSFKCQWSKKNSDGSSVARLVNAAAVVDAGGESVTVHQTLPTHNPKHIKGITFYTGDPDQLPDPLIKAKEGSSTPGFRGTSYFVIEQFLLTDYGNGLPRIQALVEVDEAETLAGAVEDLCSSAGLTQVDVSDLEGDFLGLTVPGPSPLIQSLQPVIIAYDIVARQEGAVVRFSHRSQLPQITIPEDDLAAYADGESLSDRPFREKDRSPWTIPERFNLVHIDPDKDFDTGSQWQQANTPRSAEVARVELPLVLSADDAATVAKRLRVLARINSRTVQFRLPPSYAGRVTEGMVCFLTYDGTKKIGVITTRVDRAPHSDALDCEGVREDIDAPSIKARSYRPPFVPGSGTLHPHYYPGAVVLHPMEISALAESHADVLGIYFAAAMGNQEMPWTGATLYESADNGVTWRESGRIPFEATIGYVTVPPSTNVQPDTWDVESAMEVKLLRGETTNALSSCTEEECLEGKNRLYVGGELIGFRDAELVTSDTGGDTYRLTNLIRGMRGTADVIANQQAGAVVVLLERTGVFFLEINGSTIGQSRLFAAVAPGGSVLDAVPVAWTPQGVNARPLPPILLRKDLDGSNNAKIYIMPVNRGLGRVLAQEWAASHETDLKYILEVMSGSTVVRTIRAFTTDPTTGEIAFQYSAADQTTDGFTPGQTITFRAFQESNLLREGLRQTRSM